MKNTNHFTLWGKVLAMAFTCHLLFTNQIIASDPQTSDKKSENKFGAGKKIYLTKGADNGLYINANNFSYQPGDTLVLRSSQGVHSYLSLENFRGTAAAPVVIINEGGQVQLSAIAFKHCTYMKFSGKGSADSYGFYMTSPYQTTPAPAVEITGRSSDIEVEGLDINTHGYGFWIKQEASCDPTLQFPNWRINNISVHDSRMRNLTHQGFYMGSTAPNGERPIVCNGATIYPIPPRLGNIRIYNNIIDNTGRGGIQLSGADSGNNEIYGNTITSSGNIFDPAQGNGIVLGGYTTAYVHDNTVDYSFSTGIFSLGAGLIRIENNRVDHSGQVNGRTANGSASIMIDTRLTNPVINTQFSVKNNYLGSNSDAHIRVYNSYNTFSTANTICNNTSLGGGNITMNIPVSINWSNCNGTPNQLPIVNAGADQTITLPASSVTVNGTATDADGSIASYQWSQLTGPANATIANAASASTTISALVQGTYTFRLKATDNIGASATDDISITVNAASTPPPPPPSGTTIRIEAENWSAMQSVQKEPTQDIGGGLNVGGQDANDWMDYSVNLATAGTYTLNFRIATMVAGAKFEVRNSGGTALATVSVPSTGTYQTWQTISATASLPAGQQTIRIFTTASPAGWNFNWWEIAGGSTGTNQAPTVNAGADQTITLPTSSVTVNGSATDADGSIASYQWSQVTGPANATIANATSASTTISALVQGSYTFRLKATDNAGASATDDIIITVNGSSTPSTSIKIEAENYIAMNGIQTENTADADGGRNVGWQEDNDWMDYNINPASTASYDVSFRIATPNNGVKFQVRKSDGTILATVNAPNTGGWQNWQTVHAQINLSSGSQVIRIFTLNAAGGWNINWMNFELAPPPATSVKIEAENYSGMYGVQKEATSDAGGGQNLGGQDLNDWADYSVNLASAGTYTMNFRIATMVAGAKFEVRNSGGTVLATVSVPSTGTYQTWQTISAQVTLPAGQQTIRIFTTASPAGWNLNWLEFVSGAASKTVSTQATTETATAAVTNLSVYPNPVTDRFMLQVNNDFTGAMKVQLVNMNGSVQKQFNLNKANKGATQTYLSIGDLPKGTYVIVVSVGEWSESVQLVKL